MIVVDSSALASLMLAEPTAPSVLAALNDAQDAIISVANGLEFSIFLRRRRPDLAVSAATVLQSLGVRLTEIDLRQFDAAVAADARFGKGSGHPAKLNFGDCFAYALARTRDAPLLFVGKDFQHTDISMVLPQI